MLLTECRELATPTIGQPPADTAVALDPATDPGLPTMLFRPGVTIHAGPPSSAANRLHAMSAPAGMRVVGAATSRGHYTIWIDEAKAGSLLSGGMDGGTGGDRTAMTARALSLSGGVDNRQANFVVQAGGVRSTSASPGPRRTA